jgi:alpha-beta hydrolase superfamily lysophospholipase
MQRVTRYAKSGDIHVAYQVFGEGPDLVIVPGFVSHIENSWDEPRLARWLNKLGGFCRVILFDKRGTGLSDRVAHLPHMDERMDDLRAVMDAVGIARASLWGSRKAARLRRCSPPATQSEPNHSSLLARLHGFATGYRRTRRLMGS